MNTQRRKRASRRAIARRCWPLVWRAGLLVAMAGVGTGVVLWMRLGSGKRGAGPTPPPQAFDYGRWARSEFGRRYPGQKPLNWAIARAAVELYRSQPMGRFVLGLKPGEYGNDCSDFVACAVDEGLGVKARFRRRSDQHLLGNDDRLFTAFHWRPGVTTQPGDIVSVRHSPWYPPHEKACWHVGIVGADGAVYDFVKLRRWKSARYGRHSFAWFVRHSQGPGEVVIRRLRPEYRYRIEPLPKPRPPRLSPQRPSQGQEQGEDEGSTGTSSTG